MGSRAVFLDRDGTIDRDVNYCRRVEDFEILPSVPEAIRLINENGFKVAVITNQSGIGRGYFTEETLAQIHNKMEYGLAGYGARVDAVFYCPPMTAVIAASPRQPCFCGRPGSLISILTLRLLWAICRWI